MLRMKIATQTNHLLADFREIGKQITYVGRSHFRRFLTKNSVKEYLIQRHTVPQNSYYLVAKVERFQIAQVPRFMISPSVNSVEFWAYRKDRKMKIFTPKTLEIISDLC